MLMITRENIKKLIENTGQYLIDHADELALDPTRRTDLRIEIVLDAYNNIPYVKIMGKQNMIEVLKGVDYSCGGRKSNDDTKST